MGYPIEKDDDFMSGVQINQQLTFIAKSIQKGDSVTFRELGNYIIDLIAKTIDNDNFDSTSFEFGANIFIGKVDVDFADLIQGESVVSFISENQLSVDFGEEYIFEFTRYKIVGFENFYLYIQTGSRLSEVEIERLEDLKKEIFEKYGKQYDVVFGENTFYSTTGNSISYKNNIYKLGEQFGVYVLKADQKEIFKRIEIGGRYVFIRQQKQLELGLEG